jgi:EAL domain-containing protein (putative c-di-GMP-specific phosphodiesterase class I)
MYRAKQAGRGAYHYYDIEMDRQAQRKASLEQDLRRAREREEFALHYQPQLDLASGRIVGVEALLRWQHPIRGMVSPAEFIPVAESSRLILPIGEWALAEACRQNKAWQVAGLAPLQMAVNLSALQFREQRLPELVARILAETGLDPALLELELTESILMHHSKASIEILNQLNGIGVEIAIDDFGTGYSSLSYLQRFPVQKIKLDRSFVSDYPNARDSAIIAKAVIQLGHSLNLRVVAEGVETEEQLDFLRSQGSHLAQGYHISRPLPAVELARLLDQPPRQLIA